jgi:hypothetical protein
MGILQVYTFDRNAVKANELASATTVAKHLELALDEDVERTKVQDNVIGALRNFLGVLRKEADGSLALTPVGRSFERMYRKDPKDAWRWLLTRALWKNVVPNGTAAKVNGAANDAGVEFNFFRTMLQALTAMASFGGGRRFIYYDELLQFLADDGNWSIDGIELFRRLTNLRDSGNWVEPADRRGLLGDLEDDFGIPRDNLNTVLHKAMKQTGLFEYEHGGQVEVGVALSANLDPVLQRRVRRMLDIEPRWEDK